ncbi:hypothetical protein DPMN_146818 [Dreissena polymorpha]|uniref:Uncharacterized protein n=1 Tax=Dreissena polymorpha TaxID=45954 RepID=A0A9D4IYR9_DREPO|nr:hypothetical protein DPMN_146818 [Dreissena polymorpha]
MQSQVKAKVEYSVVMWDRVIEKRSILLRRVLTLAGKSRKAMQTTAKSVNQHSSMRPLPPQSMTMGIVWVSQ